MYVAFNQNVQTVMQTLGESAVLAHTAQSAGPLQLDFFPFGACGRVSC